MKQTIQEKLTQFHLPNRCTFCWRRRAEAAHGALLRPTAIMTFALFISVRKNIICKSMKQKIRLNLLKTNGLT